jgi:antitoxin component YwqK of YwqJK toxin-antitoxin module
MLARAAFAAILAAMTAACVVPRSASRDVASLACGAGLAAASRTTPRGTEAWCEDDRGVRSGPFERRLPSGVVVERAGYAAGRLDGEFASFYSSGQPHLQGRYAHGQADGAWRGWHENGKPWLEATYASGQPTGAWLEYDFTGDKMFEGTYRDGRLEGSWRAFRKGQVSTTGTSRAGRLEGEMTKLGADGDRTELSYRNNRWHGTLIERDKDGKVVYRGEWVDGIKQGSDAP